MPLDLYAWHWPHLAFRWALPKTQQIHQNWIIIIVVVRGFFPSTSVATTNRWPSGRRRRRRGQSQLSLFFTHFPRRPATRSRFSAENRVRSNAPKTRSAQREGTAVTELYSLICFHWRCPFRWNWDLTRKGKCNSVEQVYSTNDMGWHMSSHDHCIWAKELVLRVSHAK